MKLFSQANIGYLLVFISTFIGGMVPVLLKSLVGYSTSNIQNFIRTGAAGILLIVITTILHIFKKNKQQVICPVSLWIKFLLFILTALVFYSFVQLYMLGIARTNANITAFVFSGIGPILTIAIAAIFLKHEKEHLRQRYVQIAMIVGSIGAILVLFDFNVSSINFNFGSFLVDNREEFIPQAHNVIDFAIT